MSPDTPDIPDNVKAAVEAQGQLIAGTLRREAGFSFGNRNMPAQIMWLVSLVTGELVAGLMIDRVTYHEADGTLVRQREQHGRTAYSTLLPGGQRSEWLEIAPPPSRSASN